MWYAPGHIKFSRRQVLWLLEYFQALAIGFYPEPPEGESTASLSPGAHYEDPILIHAELSTRLQQCGVDGLILLAKHGLNMSNREIAEYLNQTEERIGTRARNALNYVSGYRRKWAPGENSPKPPITYREFRQHRGKTPHFTNKSGKLDRVFRS